METPSPPHIQGDHRIDQSRWAFVTWGNLRIAVRHTGDTTLCRHVTVRRNIPPRPASRNGPFLQFSGSQWHEGYIVCCSPGVMKNAAKPEKRGAFLDVSIEDPKLAYSACSASASAYQGPCATITFTCCSKTSHHGSRRFCHRQLSPARRRCGHSAEEAFSRGTYSPTAALYICTQQNLTPFNHGRAPCR